eukprot:2654668-Alexandrium_andersonii.AAC.1
MPTLSSCHPTRQYTGCDKCRTPRRPWRPPGDTAMLQECAGPARGAAQPPRSNQAALPPTGCGGCC